MKVLKEKTVSLRSLWRRSLFILSILALAFTFASCGETTNTEYVDVPGQPYPVPGPTEYVRIPYVTRIELVNPDIFEKQQGFQGRPVDITGALLEVWMYDEATKVTTQSTVAVTAANKAEFYVYPPMPEVGSSSTDNINQKPGFRIGHVSNGNVMTSPFYYQSVYPLYEFNAEQPINFIWYTDQRIMLNNFHISGRWEAYRWGGTLTDASITDVFGVKGGKAGQFIPAEIAMFKVTPASITDLTIAPASFGDIVPFIDGYPRLDFTQVKVQNANQRHVTVTIGGGTAYEKSSKIWITDLKEPVRVEVANPSGINFRFRDDQFKGLTDKQIEDALKTFIIDNSLKFNVYYDATTNIGQTIDWATFQANRDYHLWLTEDVTYGGQIGQILASQTDKRLFPGLVTTLTTQSDQFETGVLVVNNSTEQMATFGVDYVGSIWGGQDRVIASVPVPVWRFQGFPEGAVARRGAQVNQTVRQDYGGYMDQPGSMERPEMERFIDELNLRWTLKGNYSRGTETAEIPMTYVRDMFENWDRGHWQFFGSSYTDASYVIKVWPRDNWGVGRIVETAVPIRWRKPYGTSGAAITTAYTGLSGINTVRVNAIGGYNPPSRGYVTSLGISLGRWSVNAGAITIGSFTDSIDTSNPKFKVASGTWQQATTGNQFLAPVDIIGLVASSTNTAAYTGQSGRARLWLVPTSNDVGFSEALEVSTLTTGSPAGADPVGTFPAAGTVSVTGTGGTAAQGLVTNFSASNYRIRVNSFAGRSNNMIGTGNVLASSGDEFILDFDMRFNF